MSTINNPPLKKGDQPILPNDEGPAVKLLQDFLQTLKVVQDEQSHLADFGQGYSLLDGNHYGKFEIHTGHHLKNFQLANKAAIVQTGQLTEIEFSKEVNTVGFATWHVILKLQGQPIPTTVTTPVDQPSIPAPLPSVEKPKIEEPSTSGVSEATHFVKTVNSSHRLALRIAPSYVEVSKEANVDTDKKGDLVVMMTNNTLIKMIDPGVGFKCLWAQVEVVDLNPLYAEVRELQKTISLFCFMEFLHPLEGTPEILPMYCEDCYDKGISSENAILPDWTELTLCQPFYDEFTCGYYITITLVDEVSNESLAKQQATKAMQIGINNLLEFYYKQRNKDDVSRYIKAFKFASIEGWFLDGVQNQNLNYWLEWQQNILMLFQKKQIFLVIFLI